MLNILIIAWLLKSDNYFIENGVNIWIDFFL